jgi:hypothetical protein
VEGARQQALPAQMAVGSLGAKGDVGWSSRRQRSGVGGSLQPWVLVGDKCQWRRKVNKQRITNVMINDRKYRRHIQK